jgi:hypothetical protein
MDQEQTSASAEEKIALAKEYFRKVDSGDPTCSTCSPTTP